MSQHAEPSTRLDDISSRAVVWAAQHPQFKSVLRRMLPHEIRPRRILGGRLRGKWLVTSWHDYPGAVLGTTERALLEWLKRHVEPGSTWLDVGAHYGYTALALSELVGTNGMVFAFEPALTTVGHLNGTRDLNRLTQLTVVPFGLSDGTMVARAVHLERGMAEHASVLRPGPVTNVIFTVSLDRLWQVLSPGDVAVDGIKIDVQDMEIDCIRGMRGLLRRHHPQLVIEVHRGVARDDLLRELVSAGYCSEPDPILDQGGSHEILDDRSYVFSPSGVQPRST